MKIQDEFHVIEKAFNHLSPLGQISSELIEFLDRIRKAPDRPNGNPEEGSASDSEFLPKGPKGGPCLDALPEPHTAKTDEPSSACEAQSNQSQSLESPNAKC